MGEMLRTRVVLTCCKGNYPNSNANEKRYVDGSIAFTTNGK